MSFFSIEKISGLATFDVDTSGDLQINSSGGTIGIGNDNVAQHINIGTGAAARTITVGNVTGVSALAFNSGTGGIAMASTGAGDITINSDDTLLLDSDGVLELNTAGGAINIGTDAVAVNTTIGNVTGTTALALNSGTGGIAMASTGAGDITINSDDTLLLDSDGDLELNSSEGAIYIGNDSVNQTISIGSDGERTITIGNSTGASAVNITSGSSGDITLDAGGADIFLKDGGTTYGSLTNSSGELVLKSGSTPTTALTFSGANITTGGTLNIGSIDNVTSVEYSGNAILVSDSGVIKSMTTLNLASEIGAVTTSDTNTFSAKQAISISSTTFTDSAEGTHFHIEGTGVTMTNQNTIQDGTASSYNQISLEPITLAATNTGVTTTNASTLFVSGAPSAGANMTIIDAYALNINSGASKLGGNVEIGGNVELSVQEATTTITSDGSTSLTISKSVVLLSHVGDASTQTYTIGDGTDGQIVHFFFATEASDQIIELDFGDDNTSLASGSGLARYLTFNVTGQSATLVFTEDRTLNSVVIAKCWRIINTGSAVS